MKASFKFNHFSNSEALRKNRKENGFFLEYAIVGKNGGDVISRFYMPGAEKMYCCLWVHGKESANKESAYLCGGGNAGGHGYCKKSAAFAVACESAGITFGGDRISGRGESAIWEALEAIGIAAGISKANQIRHTANA